MLIAIKVIFRLWSNSTMYIGLQTARRRKIDSTVN